MVNLAKNQQEFLKIFLAERSIPDQQCNTSAHKDLIFFCVLEMIFLTIVAMLSGQESFNRIIDFQTKNSDLLKRYLPFEQEISKDIVKFLFGFFDFKSNILILLDLVNNLLIYIRDKYNNSPINLAVNKDRLMLKICNNSTAKNIIIKQAIAINNKQKQEICRLWSDPSSLVVSLEVCLSYFDQGSYRLARNMLVLRSVVIDIIKLYKVRKCSKLGINIIRRLANNNSMMLTELIDHWVYNVINNQIIY